jgi:hypothetical protein
MNVFVSGPMTGRANYNERKFIQAQIKLRGLGAEHIYNPIMAWLSEPSRIADGRDHESYMTECLHELTRTRDDGMPFYDVVVQLDGWKKSLGAKAEYIVAESCGIPCVSISDIV